MAKRADLDRDQPLSEYTEDTIEEPFDLENDYDMDTGEYFDLLFDDLDVSDSEEDIYG